jgi:oligopeptide transport system permease protein
MSSSQMDPVATSVATPVPTTQSAERQGTAAGKPRSLFSDAMHDLRHNPIFWVALVLSLLVIVMGIFPSLFTPNDPADCALNRQYASPHGWALAGYDFQGCDVFARSVYGARISVKVGFLSIAVLGTIALLVGLSAGYFGGWIDAILSRITEIVLGVPYLLAGIVLAKRLSAGQSSGVWTVVFVIGVLSWTTAARVVRSSVITAKSQDYVAAARMLGARNGRIMWRHILPNSLAPFVVVLTIALGAAIATEATLTFLGIGIRPSGDGRTISWGLDISNAVVHVRESAIPLIVPSIFLSVTVLAFIMLGDAIRDAFDPKLR